MKGDCVMQDIIEVYDNYSNLGIQNRRITEGKEIELVREYVEYRKSTFIESEDRKLAIFLESKIENSYPDIVFVEYNPYNYLNWNSCRSDLKKDDLKVLYHIYAQRNLDISEIVNQLGITWKSAALIVERLYDSNLIIRKNSKWIIKNKSSITTYKIEAVEAKLKQWEQVLQQSIINKNFASESYALSVIDSKPKKETISKFKRFGVGIYLRNENGFEIMKTAKKAEIPVSFNSIFFNEWIGRILNSEEVSTNVEQRANYRKF